MISKEEFIRQILDDILRGEKKPSFKERCLIKDFEREKNTSVLASDLILVFSPLLMVFSMVVACFLVANLRLNDFFSAVVFILTLFVMNFPFYRGILAKLFLLKDSISPSDLLLDKILKKWGISYVGEYMTMGKYKLFLEALKNDDRKVLKISGCFPFYFQQKIGYGIEDDEENDEKNNNIIRFYWKAKNSLNGEVFYYGENPDKEGKNIIIEHPVLCKDYQYITDNENIFNWNGVKASLDRAQEIADAFKVKYKHCIFYQRKNEVFFDVKMTLSEAFWNPVWKYSKKFCSKKRLEEFYTDLTILYNLANGTDNAHDSK